MKRILSVVVAMVMLLNMIEPFAVKATVSDEALVSQENTVNDVEAQDIETENPENDKEEDKDETVEVSLSYKSMGDVGAYYVVNGANKTAALSLAEDSPETGTSSVLAMKDSAKYQKIAITAVGDGYYTLSVIGTDMLLEVNETKVQLAAADGSDKQLWRFADAGDGLVYIESKTGVYLDCEGSVAAAGSLVCVSELDKEAVQTWAVSNTLGVINGLLYNGDVTANGVVTYRGVTYTYQNGVRLQETGKKDDYKDVIDQFEKEFSTHDQELQTPNKAADNDGVVNGTDGTPIVLKDFDTTKVYNIKKYTDKNYMMSSNDARVSNGTTFVLDVLSHTEKEQFVLEKTDDGWYYICNVMSGKVLEVKDNDTSNRAVVQMADKDGKDGQLWQFIEDGSACYIRSKLGSALESTWGKNGVDVDVWMYELKFNEGQKWVIEEADSVKGIDVADGVYQLTAYGDAKKVAALEKYSSENGVDVILKTSAYDKAEIYQITKLDGEWYSIINVLTGKALEIASYTDDAHVVIQQDSYIGTYEQQWRFLKGKDGYVVLQSRTGAVIERRNGSLNDGTVIRTASYSGANAQLWKVEEHKKPAAVSQIVNGHEYIVAASQNADYVMEVNGASVTDGAVVQIAKDSLQKHQLVKVTAVSDGWYKLEAGHSGKVYTLAATEFKSGVRVSQMPWNGSDAQLFRFIDAGSGYVYIQSKAENYLELNSAECKPGVLVVANTFNGKAGQKFKLYDTNNSNVTKVVPVSDSEVKLVMYNPKLASDAKLEAAVWSNTKGQDDIRWMEMTQNGNYWYVNISSWDFKDLGLYHAHVYSKSPTASICMGTSQFTINKKPTGWRYVNGYRRYIQEDGTIMKDVSSIFKPSSYYITIDRIKGITTVYGYNSETNAYDTPVTAFWCSVGNPISLTPYGYHKSDWKMKWKEMNASDGSYRCWASYVTEIKGAVYFHGVASNTPELDTVSRYAFNALGTPQSHGCVRLAACDAKWIYVNCPLGTQIRVGDNLDSPISQPTRYTWTGGSVGSDPTWTPL